MTDADIVWTVMLFVAAFGAGYSLSAWHSNR